MTEFFQQVRVELLRVGIWGRTGERLEAEWRDHYLVLEAVLLAQGKTEVEASTRAKARLGEPAELAKEARLQRSRRDRGWKAWLSLIFFPLVLGPGTFLLSLELWILVSKELVRQSAMGPIPLSFQYFAIPAIVLIPFLASFFTLWHACLEPKHGQRYLQLFAAWTACSHFGVGCYVMMKLQLQAGLFDFGVLTITTLSLVIAITPWRIRREKLRVIN